MSLLSRYCRLNRTHTNVLLLLLMLHYLLMLVLPDYKSSSCGGLRYDCVLERKRWDRKDQCCRSWSHKRADANGGVVVGAAVRCSCWPCSSWGPSCDGMAAGLAGSCPEGWPLLLIPSSTVEFVEIWFRHHVEVKAFSLVVLLFSIVYL